MKKINTLIKFFLIVSTFNINATNYYSDPISGSMVNAGTSASPWAGLSAIFSANKTFLAGDTIFLRNGNHGYSIVKGINTGFVVVTPQIGHSPVISRMRISNSTTTQAQYWKFDKLTFQSQATGTVGLPSYSLLEIYPYATNITVSSCTVTSEFNTTSWTRDDWRNKCNNGIFTRPILNSNIIIENNFILNTAFALTISSSNCIVRNNTIQNFTNDASRVLGSNILFEKNKIYDLIKVMLNSENHDDLFQSFTSTTGIGQDTLRNNIIRGNLFINTTDTTRQFRGTAQGIGGFDGPFLNWIVENNIILCDHWHGISFYGAIGCKIINNTVLDPYKFTPIDPFDNNASNTGPAWIRIDKKTNGPASSNNVVSNNLLANIVAITSPTMGIASNNISIGSQTNYANFFVNVNDFSQPINFDLHLKSTSTAIDAGTSTNAPLFDFDGVSRPQGLGFDIGAYEYQPLLTSISNSLNNDDFIKFYPNPANNELIIENKNDGDSMKLEFVNYFGTNIYSIETTSKINRIDVSKYPKGIYFITLKTNTHSVTKKIILE